jgi:hypothetical protein
MLISPAGRRRREITEKNKQTRHLFARSEKEQQRPLKRKCKLQFNETIANANWGT